MALFTQALPIPAAFAASKPLFTPAPVAAPKPVASPVAAPKPVAAPAAPKPAAVNPYLAPLAAAAPKAAPAALPTVSAPNNFNSSPAVGATRSSMGTSDAGNTGTFYSETWDGSRWVKNAPNPNAGANLGAVVGSAAPAANTISQSLAQAYGASKGFTGQATGGALNKYIADNNLGSDYLAFQQYVNSPAGQAALNQQGDGARTLDVAGMNQYQQEALQRLGQGTGQMNPNIAANLGLAGQAAARLSTPYDPNSYKQFMNPYIDEVVKNNAADINRSYNINRNQINEDMAGAGGFGSTAQGVERSLTNEAEGRQVGNMSAQLRAQGYDTATGNALNLYGTGLNAASTQAGLYGNLANQYQGFDQYGRNVATTDQENKLSAGNQIQAQNQKELDAYFAERDKAFNYPYINSDYYKNILSSYPTGTSATSTTPGVGAIQGAIGGGLLGSALAKGY